MEWLPFFPIAYLFLYSCSWDHLHLKAAVLRQRSLEASQLPQSLAAVSQPVCLMRDSVTQSIWVWFLSSVLTALLFCSLAPNLSVLSSSAWTLDSAPIFFSRKRGLVCLRGSSGTAVSPESACVLFNGYMSTVQKSTLQWHFHLYISYSWAHSLLWHTL